jgi:hypothetical protein
LKLLPPPTPITSPPRPEDEELLLMQLDNNASAMQLRAIIHFFLFIVSYFMIKQ